MKFCKFIEISYIRTILFVLYHFDEPKQNSIEKYLRVSGLQTCTGMGKVAQIMMERSQISATAEPYKFVLSSNDIHIVRLLVELLCLLAGSMEASLNTCK